MQLGDVLGSVTATEKVPGLSALRLLVVQRVDANGVGSGLCDVAVDLVGAGPGDRVVLAEGSAARQVQETRSAAVDLAIVGIVDSVDLTEGVAPRSVTRTRTIPKSAPKPRKSAPKT